MNKKAQRVQAWGAIVTFMMVMGTWQGGVAEPLARITVNAGEFARQDIPVSIPLEGIGEGNKRLFEVDGSGARKEIPFQVDAGVGQRMWWILSGKTPAGNKRTFEIETGRASAIGRIIQASKNDQFLEIHVGQDKVLRYQHAVMPPPEGVDPLYARSGFIHPLWSPAQEVLTEIRPSDHYHHLGVWMPWVNTKFEGREVDFWNLKKGQGTVRFVDFGGIHNGPVFGSFQANHEHVDLKAPGGEKVVLNEEWNVRVWNVGGKKAGYWIWDLTSVQRCASESPLELKAYRYGGLGFRATAKWKKDNANYLTSEGLDRDKGHATRSRWCMMFGPTDKGPAGVLIMSHPSNHEHPEPMRIWPSDSNKGRGDIFFNYTPIQKADWTLKPGRDYVFRYRFYVYNGKLPADKADALWADFAQPPKVKVVVTH